MKNVTQALRSSEPAAAPHNSSAEAQTSLTDESTAPQSSMSGPGASMQALMPDRWLRQPQQMELWTSLGQNNSPARPTSFSITKDDLIQWAQKPDGSNRIRDLLGSKWNVWAEGRVTGTTDTVAATNSLGFNGNIGADYRFFPWMIAGLSLGVESFSTNLWSAGSQINATGVSAVPYVGFRLDPNLFASAYVGITGLSYNSIPELGVSAAFGATRLFAGANLSGYWQDGPWRFEPAISIVYGSEWQTAFTDSANNAVPGETIEFGRVSAGPEIGYTFRDSEGTWQLEPYFRTQINLDFATNENTFLNGLLVNTRSTVSGTLAGGIFYRSAGNFSVRGEGSYESLGVAGLDAWSVIINLNFAF